MNKLLVICGPTSTGKTKLALYLSKLFNGEIISADSRQVYKGMDIGTGKDLPVNSKFKCQNSKVGCYYEIKKTRIWGYDLVEPKEEFSVSKYAKFANKVIDDIYQRGKLPILVGGTGLYIKAVIDGIATVNIPKNNNLRDKLENKEAIELFETLAQIDPIRAGSMNLSDKRNQRRLIRAIEIGEWNLDHKEGSKKSVEVNQISNFDNLSSFQTSIFNYPTSVLEVGLTTSKEQLFKIIKKRVQERLETGIEEEIKQLLARGVKWSDQSMTSLGYRQWREYCEDRGRDRERDRDRVIEIWIKEEQKYTDRQMTWFKKDKRINWFDISKREWKKKVENLVKKWYSCGRS